jgi:hypothetical protein
VKPVHPFSCSQKFPPRDLARMGQQGVLEKEKKKRKTRVPSWRLWETRCGIRDVVAIRDKFAQGLDNAEMMREFNRLFADLVDECENLNLCVDHHGFQDRFLFLVVHHDDTHIYVLSDTVEISGHGF